MVSTPSLSDKLSAITYRIQSSAARVNRNPNEIKLVAVTKSFPPEIWLDVLNENLTCIGENRVLEAEDKSQYFPCRDRIELHLIGHLQSNKTRKAVELFDVIQTVDSIKLARRLNTISKEKNKIQRIFVQVNTGDDPKKQGFSNKNILSAAEEISNFKNLFFNGIMTIPPNGITNKELSLIYRKTREHRNVVRKRINSDCKYLSMGMSGDFETAIAEGATHIRIGTALFGERPK